MGPIDWESLEQDAPHRGVTTRTTHGEGLTITMYTMAPGGSFPRHSHDGEQIITVLDGEVQFAIDNAIVTLTGGQSALVSPHVAHGADAGGRGARFIMVSVPKRGSEFLIDYLP